MKQYAILVQYTCFHMYSRKGNTETTIHETFKCEILMEQTLKITHITFSMTWSILKTSNLLKKDIKSYKNIDIYYIGYITMKDLDYVNIYSVNTWYFVTDKIDGFIEENDENKYLTLVCNYKNKEVLTKYTELWNKIKSLMEKINDKPGEYEKRFIKIK